MSRTPTTIQFESAAPSQETPSSILYKLALFATLFFIFSIPWGNAVWDGLTRIIGMVAFGLMGISLMVHGLHTKFSLFHLVIALFGVWLSVSLMWSPDIERGSQLLFTILQLLTISILVTLVIYNKYTLLLFYQSYTLGNLVGAGIIIYNYLNNIESVYYGRFAIPNLDIDGQSVMLTLAIPMAAYLSTLSQSKWLKMLYTASIPLIMFAVFLTGTRTASVVAIIGIAYWLFSYRNASVLIKTSFIVVFILSAITVFTLAPQKSVDRIFTTGESITKGTLNNRTVIWGASFEQWKKVPLVGVGIGSLGYALNSLHVEYSDAHNAYLHIMVENGIIGLLLYLTLLMLILYYILFTPFSEKIFLLSVLFTILVSQITQHTHLHKETWFVLTMLAIHAYTYSRDKVTI